MRVVHVNLARDRKRRRGEQLLDAWPTLTATASAVSSTGADVAVVQSADEDVRCERDGVPVHFVAEPWLGVRPAAGYSPLRIARTVKALNPDVIHVNGFGFPFHTRSVTSLGFPVLAQDHGDRPGGRIRLLRRWGLANIAGVAFTACEQATPFFQDGSFRQRLPVFSIPESSTHFHEGDKEQARIATGLCGKPAMLWVGHLNENKDPLTVVQAFSMVLRRIPNAHLWCCYRNAPLLDRVRSRIREEPELSERIHLLGAVPHNHVELLCRAADFFLLASKRESCGYALLEALACGATPIVSDIPAFRAITANGAIGALCRPGNAAEFAGAMVALSDRRSEELQIEAVNHFKAELSFPVLGRKLVAAYRTLIDRTWNGARDGVQ